MDMELFLSFRQLQNSPIRTLLGLFGFLSQEKDDYALYCDARVVRVLRRLHGPTECRCIFIIRYVHDKTEVIFDFLFFLVGDLDSLK